ncbi:hypothetical protein CC2G_001532 [Coprinopsis cinerea AmutBmut pab1-1]|nr:hypothetical protein CC2G_004916 [Coprinopsis cinerea AmutBmut pab1-1]KAG2023928.1 hypothetical protein CC2G_001532 [Coprinopsis cinerea AmutBmut pab1-1]
MTMNWDGLANDELIAQTAIKRTLGLENPRTLFSSGSEASRLTTPTRPILVLADPQTLTTLSSFGIRFCQPECTPACLEPQLGLQNDTRRHLSLQCSRHPPHPVPFRLTNPQLNSAQIQVTVHPGSPAEDSTFNLSGSHP